jgi:hypothetical protein
MYSIRFDSKQAMKMLNNLVQYSDGFIKETQAKESYVASRLGSLSIEGFYDYLDVLARTHPQMLHHVYEWGQVGDPYARLVELKKIVSSGKVDITSIFLESESIQDGGKEPFYDKAEIMEDGIPVTIQEVDAQALFFTIGGEEFFRMGPIIVENPGGEQVRGSFVNAFEEFYNSYFDQVYLQSIRFYDHFKDAKEYQKNFNSGVRSSNARSIGKKTALSWVMNAPGAQYE